MGCAGSIASVYMSRFARPAFVLAQVVPAVAAFDDAARGPGCVHVFGVARVDRESDDRILMRFRKVGRRRDPLPAVGVVLASVDVASQRPREDGVVLRFDGE